MRLGLLAAAVLVLASATACGSDAPAALKGVVRTPALNVSSVSLPSAVDGSGPVTMKPSANQLYLVYFGYTNCPDVCPTTLSDIRVALDDLPSDLAERVTVAMATVDPERDTAQTLTSYLGHFFDNGIPLRTTDTKVLDAATEAFGVQYELGEPEANGGYAVAHTAFTYVVDDTGTVVVEWPFGFESRSMTSDLRYLLDKKESQ